MNSGCTNSKFDGVRELERTTGQSVRTRIRERRRGGAIRGGLIIRTACPEFRKGSCPRGDVCEYAHGVFECWLHPSRYRTQLCKDGAACDRPGLLFAHHTSQFAACPDG